MPRQMKATGSPFAFFFTPFTGSPIKRDMLACP
jgi:hypothetical protein